MAELIEECHKKGQPVLVGTISIESSEIISNVLNSKGIKHEVLNAKNHAREAEIVANAGQPGGVTIATNMAVEVLILNLPKKLRKMVVSLLSVQKDMNLVVLITSFVVDLVVRVIPENPSSSFLWKMILCESLAQIESRALWLSLA